MNTNFNPDKYLKPTSLDETYAMLSEGSAVIAGGTDLLVNKPPEVNYLVDIKGLGLDYIKQEDGVRIGSTTTFTQILNSKVLDEQPLRVLKDAAREVGHHNLRHIATIGGNICNAVPSADSPIALIALDAKAVIQGRGTQRRVSLDGFFTFVRETVLRPGEFLKEVRVPTQVENTGASFQKLGRTKVDIALVNAACRITVEDGIVHDSRIVLGAVAPTPVRAREAETRLNGGKLNEVAVAEASELAASATSPISDVRASAEYRREISKVLVRRAINEAYSRAMEVSK